MNSNQATGIPNEVVAKIVKHRPNLVHLAERGEHVHLARVYLMGESRLTMHETDRLAAVAAGMKWQNDFLCK